MGAYKQFLLENEEELEPDHPDSEDPKNYRKEKKMALGKGKKEDKKKSGGKKGERDNSGKRYVASIWENENDRGSYLSMSVDNLDPDSEYHKGNLIWFDKESGKYYKVKALAVYSADKGPRNLTNKIVLDLNNEHHVEEIEQD